jgi:5'-phosphate synthase pdxT subunit
MVMKVGVLRFQGDVREHLNYFKACGAETLPVVKPDDLANFDALVIPGGESTTIARFIYNEGFDEAIKEFLESGRAVFATCAGLILLAKEVIGNKVQGLGFLDVVVERNAYGRQRESFEAPIQLTFDLSKEFNGVFIRAPRIVKVDKEVEVLGEFRGEPVLVKQERVMAATFHPELTEDLRIGKYFINNVVGG